MNPISQLGDWIADLMHQMGLPGVAFFVALEKVFPPIPSELILPLAGFLAGRGRWSLPAVIIAATIGSVAGALILYWIAARLGEARARSFAQHYGRWLQISNRDLDRAGDWFDRYGDRAVLIGPLIPVIRSAVSVPAGFRGMSAWKFAGYTSVGSAVWNSILIGLGWWLGDRWQLVEQYTGYFSYAVLALVIAGIGWFIWKRRIGSGERRSDS